MIRRAFCSKLQRRRRSVAVNFTAPPKGTFLLASQMRLILNTAAYWLMLTVRDAIPSLLCGHDGLRAAFVARFRRDLAPAERRPTSGTIGSGLDLEPFRAQTAGGDTQANL